MRATGQGIAGGRPPSTRLSRLHPYPAMVADELARALAEQHVAPGARVLDPFCGSGRLLVAAETASLRVGFDVNPLAWLLTRAKLASADGTIVEDILKDMASGRASVDGDRIGTGEERKVDWFAPDTWRELERVVAWINAMHLAEPERLVVAAALSATVREVSYARQRGWKLHRLDSTARESFSACPWDRLERRLRYCLGELRSSRPPFGSTRIELADVRTLAGSADGWEATCRFDVVLTSPPYGDSRTTVQYGAASALCLSVVRGIEGFEDLGISGGAIDADCLGGRSRPPMPVEDLSPYWSGSRLGKEGRLVERFLADYGESCDVAAASLAPGGKAVFIVGCRSIGGERLRLDRFTTDRLEAGGMHLVSCAERPLSRKRVPCTINRFGRSTDAGERARGVTATMANEIILVARKTPEGSPSHS